MFDPVIRDFTQGLGIGVVLFLGALPMVIAVRLLYKVPSSWGKLGQAFILFMVCYGVLRSFVGGDLNGFVNILVVPCLVYLPCAYAVSARGQWLWRGRGLLTVPLLFIVAISAAVVLRLP